MKKAYSLEILILFFTGSGGIIVWVMEKWYLALAFGTLWFGACSYLMGCLKRETLKEYINLVNKQNAEDIKSEVKE